MKKIVLHLAGILLIALISAGNAHSADSELIGSWEFSASSAPWEYNKGTLIFEVNDEETLDGKVVFHTGREITINSINREGDAIEFIVFVDGYDVRVVCNIDENNLTGEAITAEGNLPISAVKQLSEE